ncbi:AGE family epimerase/isomerase [Aurantiacibacter poecillastricola]|uniref:AGE family epimerase/isomerase n=1 Tax=Aurantiacibacter poecillastricola TaxID=3064385 RepID=UPI00273FD0E1|nr:AGE family epimerase/isomerase [Aurantiacibacter sp. 219JJ12-13]MDP5261162.1 AGE family epimerase/isomerase [Aurantiacibacter sp. 219JJ12-13]
MPSTPTREDIDDLLRKQILPRFVETGGDRGGGFVERFDWQGTPLEPGFRRVRVAGRQTYVAAHAAIGEFEGAFPVAKAGADYLLTACRADNGLFVSRLAPDNRIVDPAPDLYDNAFALFGLSWWYRASGDEAALKAALQCVDGLHTLRSPTGQGFQSRPGKPDRHEQNPHMHLFEAALAWAAFTGHDRFHDLAKQLFDLCCRTLFDRQSGTLAEWYDREWQRHPSQAEASIEPGHHYEWVWLLHRFADLTENREARAIAVELYSFARRWGHDPTSGLVYSAVDRSGQVLANDLRIWPNLEYLKARIARREASADVQRQEDRDEIDAIASAIVSHFLTPASSGPAADLPAGLWIDWLRNDAATINCDHIPASTLYHIMLAFTELLRHDGGHDAFSGRPW